MALFCMFGCWSGQAPAQKATAPATNAVPTQGTTDETPARHGSVARASAATHRPTIGITFEGGGALGLAHIGVMLWLEEHRVPVDSISGTSMGALVGAFFAAGDSPADVKALATSDAFATLFTTQPLLSHSSFRRRQDRQDMPQALTLGLKSGVVNLGDNLITDDQLNALLRKKLSAYNGTELNFDDLPIPFRAVASNLTTLEPYVFSSGPLSSAVRASLSIPGVFAPVHSPAGILVDGAVLDNLPTDVLRKELHPDVVISVYLGDAPFTEKDAISVTSVVERALSAATARNVALNRPLADIEILPAVTNFSVTDYAKSDALIRLGYDAAETQRTRLLVYALTEADWNEYKTALASRERKAPTELTTVRIDGPVENISARLAREAKSTMGNHLDAEKANEFISNVRGDGALDASWETFHSTSSSGSSATSASAKMPDDGLLIRWKPNTDGPPYMLASTAVSAMNANVTSAVLRLRFVDENLGAYGAELRSDAEVGYLTRLRSEYYLPVASSRFYIQPHALYLREPVYYWRDQKRVSERLLQRAGGGLELGAALSRNMQASVQYQNASMRWVLKAGEDDSPNQHLSGTMQSAAAHFFETTRTGVVASPTGHQIDFTIGRLFHSAQSQDSPFGTLKARQSFTFEQVNSLVLSVDASTYFRHNVADPLRFTLGGPMHLSASSVDEYRGTDTGLIQAMYLRRLANLPTGIGHGIYFATGYEAGSIWSPERTSILRQDGVAGILLNTPVGVLTLGGAIGDAGHRKVFFTLGRFF